MSSLPSFVDLTDSLGLEKEQTSTPDQSPSPQSSSPRSPVVGRKNAPTRSSSSPSLRDVALHHISRYSPYPSAPVRHVVLHIHLIVADYSPSPQLAVCHLHHLLRILKPLHWVPWVLLCFRIWYISNNVAQAFTFSSRRRQRKLRNKALHAIAYGSSSDLTADTPISTYVRRKTPGTSPTSPTFAPDSGYESSSSPTAMPFSIPSLPDLLANSSSSESVPNLPSSDSEFEDHVKTFRSRVKRTSKSNNKNCRIVRRPTGVRISVPPYPNNLRERFMDLWSIQFYTPCSVGLFCWQPFFVVLSNPFLSAQISVQQYATQNPSQYI